MTDSFKLVSCCSQQLECSRCDQYATCKQWSSYVGKHERSKGYAHFDRRTSLSNCKTRSKVLNPRWVAHHGFWPFIHYSVRKGGFKGAKENPSTEPKKKSTREIRYCSHIDRCIYQRYSFLLDCKYNDLAAEVGIDESAIAYRTNRKRCNIDYAKQAFDFIQSHQQCIILVTDFESFFDNIDHATLKSALCKILDVDKLPADYYAVYKNTTKYREWDWKHLIETCGLRNSRKARKEMNAREVILDTDLFREYVKQYSKTNPNMFGIPQGSPISAVFSNIYMIQFDQALKDIANSFEGLYLRYCDDLLLVIPVIDENLREAIGGINQALKCIEAQKGIEIKQEKTDLLLYDTFNENSKLLCLDDSGCKTENSARLDYLGFSFDGYCRQLRSRTISKYHYRMHRKAKTTALHNRGTINLYGTYSERAILITGKRSFVDYAKRASAEMDLEDPSVDRVVKQNMEKIAKTINKYKRSQTE